MLPRPFPSDAEIRAAFAQGEAAVIALYRRWAGDALPSPPKAIHQGEVYWLTLDDSEEPGAGIPHPYVVVQEDAINLSRVPTVVVCALTSNLNRASLPGNVRLEAGEANLPKPSVVEVSKVSAVDKNRLGGYIGTLPPERVSQILTGMRFVQTLSR